MKTKKKRTFTEEFKRDAVFLLQQEGYGLKEVSSRLGIHVSVLGRWRRQFEKEMSGFAQEETSLVNENRRLKEREAGPSNRRLRLERDILKKATVFLPGRPP